MDKKTAFVIGTSHSYASCEEGGIFSRINRPDRWQDNLENHGYKVTTFARPGCTAEHQLDAFFHYMADNPSSYWDLIIIEGRDAESSVSYPHYVPTKNKDTKNIWHHWIHDEGDRIKKFNFDFNVWRPGEKYKQDIRDSNWYKEYVGSHLHLINTWATNSALCTLASKHAKVVKWFTFGSVKHPDDIQNKSNLLQHMFLGEYCIADTIPALQQTYCNDEHQPQLYKNLARIFEKKPPESDTRCECGHLNKLGNKLLWDLILEPALIKENVL